MEDFVFPPLPLKEEPAPRATSARLRPITYDEVEGMKVVILKIHLYLRGQSADKRTKRELVTALRESLIRGDPLDHEPSDYEIEVLGRYGYLYK